MLSPMKRIRLLLTVYLAAMQLVQGGENSLGTVYQPLDPMVDGSVVVREVPFVTSGPYPEVFFSAITLPHVPQQGTQQKTGDINVASRAGLSLRCESASAGQKKLYIIWDFSKADPKLVNDELIDALLLCLEKTAGKVNVLYSKFVGEDRFPRLKNRILAQIPEQTEPQRKADSLGKKHESGTSTTPQIEPNKARQDNRWGSPLSVIISSISNINSAIDAHCRPSGASA
jgi:hypothetical protein